MASKPTPGPWEWEYYPELEAPIALSASDGDVLICSGDDHYSYGIASEADLRLIAAAPALLEACEAVLHQLDYLQGLWGSEGITDRLADRLRAAVARATGEGSS